ncbi:hypothetical protein GCM10020295_18150 [Streptomyces cinereospinus]
MVAVAYAQGTGRVPGVGEDVERGAPDVRCRTGGNGSGMGLGLDVASRVRGCEGRGRCEEREGEQGGDEGREQGPECRTSEHEPPSALIASLARTNDWSMAGQERH